MSAGTPERRLTRVLRGEALTPPPVWLMRQAGRYLAEYRAVREKAGSFLDLCFNPELAAEVTLQPIRRFGFDAAILFADILLIPKALGQDVWFETGEGPRLAPVASASDADRLEPGKAQEDLAPIIETVRRVRAALPPETALIGFAGAPWTVATYMIAGRGTSDQAEAKRMAYEAPEVLGVILDRLIDATADYLCAQIEAGCDTVQIFDTWAGGLAPALMERCVLTPTAALVARVKARHPTVPVIGFPRGVGSWIGPYARRTGVDAVGLGTGEYLPGALKDVPPAMAVQGTLDPLALLAGGPALEDGARAVLEAMKGRPHIFNLGHGILPPTPPEHVSRLLEIVRGHP